MSELDAKDRQELKDSDYAFPKQRKEPLNDADHVRNAMARFDQVEGVSDDDRDEAWKRIKSAAKAIARSGRVDRRDGGRILRLLSLRLCGRARVRAAVLSRQIRGRSDVALVHELRSGVRRAADRCGRVRPFRRPRRSQGDAG